MFKDFKFFGTSRNERFIRGLVLGIPAAIIIGATYGAIMHYSRFPFEFSYVIAFLGVMVAYVVRYVSRGVQKKFAILAAALTVLCIIVADMVMFFGFNIFDFGFFFCLQYTLQFYFTLDPSNILSVLFRIFAVIMAYRSGSIR